MDVYAHKTTLEKNQWLHWEMMRETCQTFGAELHQVGDGAIDPSRLVILDHKNGQPLHGFEWPESPVIWVGCDDDNKTDADGLGGLRVKIETPEPYFLWSVVAVGIALYDYAAKRNIASNR